MCKCFLRKLYTFGKITFPLIDRKQLKDIKAGRLDYKKEVAPLLEYLMFEVKSLANNSDYPEKVDREYWNKFIIFEVERSLRG